MEKDRVRKLDRIFSGIFILYIILSGLFLYNRYLFFSKINEEKTVSIAKIALIGLDDNLIFKLKGNISDQNTFAYRNIKERLSEITNIDTDIISSYMYIQRDGNLYFLVDSEPIDSEDYSPPGQQYTEASPEFYTPFETGEKYVTRPVKDRWGTWISILIPVTKQDGSVFAVFAKNYPAETWNSEAIMSTINTAGILFTLFFILFALYITIKGRMRVVENERKYKRLAENTSDIIWTSDLNLNTTYISPSVEKTVGESVKKHIKRKLEERFPPKYIKQLKKKLQKEIKKTDKEKSFTIEVEQYKADGTTFWAEMTINFLINQKKKIVGIQGVTRDITARKEARKLLEESKRQYESLVRNMPGIAYRCLKDKNWTMKFISNHIKETSGYPASDFINNSQRTFASIIHKDDVSMVTQEIDKAIKNKNPWDIEYRITTKDGRTRWLQEKGNIIKGEAKKDEFLDGIIIDVTEQKKVREEIIEREERYEELARQSRTFVWEVDTNANYTYVSSNSKEIIGYSKDEMEGKMSVFDLHPKEGLDVFEKDVKETIKKREEINNLENPIIHKDGKTVWALTSGLPIIDEDGKLLGYRGSDIDITSRKKDAERIRHTLEQQTLLSEITTQLSRYTNLDRTLNSILKKLGENTKSDRTYIFRDNKDGITTSNTHEWCNTGIKAAIQNLQNLPYSDIKGMEEAFEKVGILKSSDTSKLEASLKKNLQSQDIKSVLIIPLLVRKRRIGFIGFDQVKNQREWEDSDVALLSTIANSISNVYEREENIKEIIKSAEEIVNERNKIETIIKGIGDAVFVISEEKEIILFNKTAKELSGYSAKEAVGRKYKEILEFRYENNDEINDEFITNVFKSGENQEMRNHTYLTTKDGRQIAVADSAAAIKDASGKITDCVVVFRDVSKEREVDRMKTEFVSVASHQLKTPLSGIKWTSDILMRERVGELNTEQKEYLKDIQFSNNRMIKLIDDLLDVSHIETGRKFIISKKKTNVVGLVKEVLNENTDLAKKKKVSIVMCENTPTKLFMNIDGGKIKEVFANLTNNAIKYSKEGGAVEIGCDSKKGEKIFWIKDKGIGIPKKQQEKIFNKFFRADNAFTQQTDGTGLGLYIAKSIIEAHDGEIWFESEAKKGTTFFFSLPYNTKK